MSDDTPAPDEPSSPPPPDKQELYVVGIGASAGGLSAFRQFFKALPDDTGMAYVVVQHLSPDKQSELVAILSRMTDLPVTLIEDTTALEPDHVFVIPPDKSLSIEDDTLRLGAPINDTHRHVVIDHFLETLGETKYNHGIAVILSGSQSDGARGVMAVKNRGGMVLVQSPADAEYSSMPESAIDTGCVDLVLPAEQLAQRLASIAGEGFQLRETRVPHLPGEDEDERAYRRILDDLHRQTGHDFSHYKRSTMLRRIDRRRRLQQLPNLTGYAEFLDDHDEETRRLFDELLITVTGFFRDREAFDALAQTVIPPLFEQRPPDQPIRVWVPGCATGEEAYSIAMLLLEEAERCDLQPHFKIFATDLDRQAIAQARRGVYSSATCADLESERKERFFTAHEGGFKVRKTLRDSVLFAVHDILQDPPFARLDLISCRNLLIYLERQAQHRVFQVMYYALNEEGFLFLGASEFLGDATELFVPLDKAHRIYRARPGADAGLPITRDANRRAQAPVQRMARKNAGDSPTRQLAHQHHRLLSQRYAPPAVLVDKNNEIVHLSGNLEDLLRVPPGKPTTNLLDQAVPSLRLPLRMALADSFEQSRVSTTGAMRFEHSDRELKVRIVVRPATEIGDDQRYAQVLFENVDDSSTVPETVVDLSTTDPTFQELLGKLESENERLRDELHQTVERHETTTEELKASNEELLTINEELQSTTEELETSKEELQSTNEELLTVNEELNERIVQLDNVNSDLQNLLASTDIGTIFLDESLNIRRFTAPVKEYFNLIDADIGRPIEHVTHRLQYEDLVEDVHGVLHDLQPVEREICCDDGDWFIIRILPYRTTDDRIDGAVLTFFDITDRKSIQRRLAERELLFRTVFESASDGLFIYELDDAKAPKHFTEVNDTVCRRLGYRHEELATMSLVDIVDSSSIDLEAYLRRLRHTGEAVEEARFVDRSKTLTQDELSSRLFTVGETPLVLTISRDIAARKQYEEALLEAKEESDRLADMRATFLANMSHEIRTPLTSIIGVSQLLERNDLADQHDKMVRLIQSSGRRLRQTLDSVLEISRIEAGEMAPRYQHSDVMEQIRQDVEMLQPQAEREEIDLRLSSTVPAHWFWTDTGFLHRIVYNLVENGIKFTDQGFVEVLVEPADEELVLTVRDTGIGIEPDFLPHLFEKFKRASAVAGGTSGGSGLGMALVKHVVDLLEGSISVDSTPEKGTTFTVRIPEHNPEE